MIDTVTLCLAMVVFREARSEPLKAKYSVLEVVHNRSKDEKFKDDYCSVIKSKGQFSWFKNHNSMKPPKYELDAWKESIAVARDFQRKKTTHVKGALYFNHVSMGVRYKTNVRSVRIGRHIFY